MTYRYDLPDDIELPRADALRKALFAIHEMVSNDEFNAASDHLYELVQQIAGEAESALQEAREIAPPED